MKMRKLFFIKPYLQFRFIIFMTVITFFTVFFIYFTFELSIVRVFESLGIARAEIQDSLLPMRLYTMGVLAVILIAVATLSVLYFHNFIGPLFSLERSLEKIKAGDLTADITTRKEDQLRDLAKKLKQMSLFFKEHIKADRDRARKINETIATIIEHAKRDKLTDQHIADLSMCQRDSSQITEKFTL